MPQFTVKSKNIVIPKYFIETLMPFANPTFVKVYLYAFMLACDNLAIENSFIASQLGILESDVVGAFSYWQSVGIIKMDNNSIEFLPMPDAQITQPVQPAPAVYQHTIQPIPQTAMQTPPPAPAPNPVPVQSEAGLPPEKSYSAGEVANAIRENEILSEIFVVAQSMLGKPLNTQDTTTLYSFYDWLGFQPEIILLLLEHCISTGKTSMKYIEKVAISWHEQGLFTAEKVMEYLENAQNKKTFLYNVRKILGILDRNPASIEENYINTWCSEYGMSEDMVSLAYEYCVMQTQKLSMPYMDKIMKRWHEQGINTVEAAKLDNENFKAKGGAKKSASQGFEVNNPDAYNYDEIERRMWENMKK